MRMIAEVGDSVLVKEYCYENLSGGTEMSYEKVRCKIIKAWEDYECGWRYWATPVGKYKDILKGKSRHNRIYVSEFDIMED